MIDIEKWNDHMMNDVIKFHEENSNQYALEIGKTYNNLKCIKYIGKDKNFFPHFLFRCNLCGNEKIISLYSVRKGATTSCGCYHDEIISAINHSHGMSNSRIYRIYNSMKARCYRKNDHNYIKYGAKGIKICDEWLDKDNGFNNFYNWSIKNGYDNHLTIDRINPYKDYNPNNCRWTDDLIQARNKRNTIWLTYNNITLPITIWAKIIEISAKTLFLRYIEKWTDEEIICTPLNQHKGTHMINIQKIPEEYVRYIKAY